MKTMYTVVGWKSGTSGSTALTRTSSIDRVMEIAKKAIAMETYEVVSVRVIRVEEPLA